jgi:hypothetical protein
MKKSLIVSILIFILFLPIQLISQEIFKHEDSGVQLVIPAGWFYQKENNTITFFPKDRDFVVSITIHEVSAIDKIIDVLISDLSKTYSSIDISDPKEDNMNGMRGWEIHGTAKANGIDMAIDYGIYVTPKEKVLEIGAVATGDIFEKYKNDLETFLKGIKPLE